jgi:EmrB/QacA subfamily drug resistance transporter
MTTINRQDRRHGAWVLALTAAAEFMVALDVLVVTTALGQIRGDLHISQGQLEWTLSAYTVCLAGFVMTAAALGDRFGRRRMLCVGVAAFTVGSAVCALAPALGLLITGRVIQGVGAALVAPLSLPLVSAAYPPERRGQALGIVVGITGLATLAGPLIGGGLTQALGWQWIFWVNVPLGLALIVLVQRQVPESYGPDRAIDLRGVGLATASFVALAWGLVRAASVGWLAPDVPAGIGCGLALGVLFVAWERRADEPMLDVGLFASRPFAATNVATACHSAVVLGAVFLMAQFLQAELGIGSFGAGVRLLPWTGSMIVVAPLAGRLSDRIGTRPVLVAGLLASATGSTWLAYLARPGVTYSELIGALVVIGVGNSTVFPALSAAVSASVGHDHLGPAAGVNNAVREIGGVLGIAVITLAFTSAGSFTDHTSVAHGFRAAAALCAALSLLGALAGILTRTSPREPRCKRCRRWPFREVPRCRRPESSRPGSSSSPRLRPEQSPTRSHYRCWRRRPSPSWAAQAVRC